MVSGVFIFIALNHCPVQVEGFYARSWSNAVLDTLICLGVF